MNSHLVKTCHYAQGFDQGFNCEVMESSMLALDGILNQPHHDLVIHIPVKISGENHNYPGYARPQWPPWFCLPVHETTPGPRRINCDQLVHSLPSSFR